MEEAQVGVESRCSCVLRWCRAIVAFIVSHVGLVGLVVGYSIAGGVAFRELEKNTEYEMRENMSGQVSRTLVILWNQTEEMLLLKEDEWNNKTRLVMKQFQDDLVHAIRDRGYDGLPSTDPHWTIAGAILYSIIVITTIGYGNVAPKTDWGKIVTILYSIVGIPLMLLCMSNVGDAMAQSFKFLYWKVCCYVCSKKKESSRQSLPRPTRSRDGSSRKHRFSHDEFSGDESHSGSFRSGRSDDYRFMDEMAYHDPTFLRRVPINAPPVILNKYALGSNKDLLVDFPVTDPGEGNKSPTWSSHRTSSRKGKLPPLFAQEHRSVPIWLCVALVCGYLCGGAALFKLWEDKWTFFESFYFCFITLTTIGFGDFVPGKSVSGSSGDDTQTALALCAVYLLFGMALLAMSFNLVQEQVTSHVKLIGKRIGVIDDDDDDDDHQFDDDGPDNADY